MRRRNAIKLDDQNAKRIPADEAKRGKTKSSKSHHVVPSLDWLRMFRVNFQVNYKALSPKKRAVMEFLIATHLIRFCELKRKN